MSELILPPEYQKPKPGQNARGIVEKVRWFENSSGYIIIPVVPEHRCPFGFEEKHANTLSQIAEISRRHAEQKQREFALNDAKLHMEKEAKLAETKERLTQRLNSAACGRFERDFIRASLVRLEADIDKHKVTREMYFHIEAHEAGTVTE